MIEMLYRFLAYCSTLSIMFFLISVSVSFKYLILTDILSVVLIFLALMACVQVFNIWNTYGKLCGSKFVMKENINLSWWEGI
jgi:nucleoside permease NupC